MRTNGEVATKMIAFLNICKSMEWIFFCLKNSNIIINDQLIDWFNNIKDGDRERESKIEK